ncbi:MAG: hypothetical protein AABZ60_03835 [Planctomycetota bacterium]
MRPICFILVLFIFFLSTEELFTANQKFSVNGMKNLNAKNLAQSEFLSSEMTTVIVLFRSWCPASRLQISEILEMKEESSAQNKTPFHPIFIALDRKYGYVNDDFEIPLDPILEYVKTNHLKPEVVFLGDPSTVKDLKVLNAIKKIDVTPVLLFIDKTTREVRQHRKGLTKKEAIEEILSKF